MTANDDKAKLNSPMEYEDVIEDFLIIQSEVLALVRSFTQRTFGRRLWMQRGSLIIAILVCGITSSELEERGILFSAPRSLPWDLGVIAGIFFGTWFIGTLITGTLKNRHFDRAESDFRQRFDELFPESSQRRTAAVMILNHSSGVRACPRASITTCQDCGFAGMGVMSLLLDEKPRSSADRRRFREWVASNSPASNDNHTGGETPEGE